MIFIHRTTDMNLTGQVSWAGTVLGWAEDNLYVAGTDVVYQYTTSGELVTQIDHLADYIPYLTLSGKLGYISTTNVNISVRNGASEKAFTVETGVAVASG